MKFSTPNTNSILKVYQLVLKSKSDDFISQKIKFPEISPKSPQKVAFRNKRIENMKAFQLSLFSS